jgi:hypothetical protein
LPIADDPLVLGDKDVFLMAEEGKPAAKAAADKSKAPKSGSDSDVRLEKSVKARAAAAKAQDASGTEEIELDVLPPAVSPSGKLTGSGKMTATGSGKQKAADGGKSGSSQKGPAVAGGKSGKMPAAGGPAADSSEFELTLDTDSSDEFELSLASDSSDEISLGDLPAAPAKKGGQSGINLGKPSDSGPSLEKKAGGSSGKLKDKKSGDSGRKSGKLPAARADSSSDEEIDFELSLDQPGSSGKKSGPKKKVDSDSEFELTLDDSGGMSAVNLEAETGNFEASSSEAKRDIFETDFEIPALDDDSASEAVAIDEADTDLESSDFDLAIDESDVSADDESASQVVVLDDETEPPAKSKKAPAKAKKKPAKARPLAEVDDEVEVTEESVVADDDAVSFDDMELDESESASKALKGARAKTEEEEEEEAKGQTVIVQTANWGVFPALLMLPTVFIIFLGGIMAYELVHSMWGYHQTTKPASLVVDNVAKTFDLNPKE